MMADAFHDAFTGMLLRFVEKEKCYSEGHCTSSSATTPDEFVAAGLYANVFAAGTLKFSRASHDVLRSLWNPHSMRVLFTLFFRTG